MPRRRNSTLMKARVQRPRLTFDGRRQIQQRHDEITDVRLPELRPLLAERERDERDVAAFERLLAHNRNARFVWAHAGTDSLGTRTPP